jgi:hypothetical protein
MLSPGGAVHKGNAGPTVARSWPSISEPRSALDSGLTQCSALFAVVHIFLVMETGSRRIAHVNVTTNPTLAWVKLQVREMKA